MIDRPTLYRKVGTPKRVRGRQVVGGFEYVPVETCEHGFHTSHWVVDVDRYGFPVVTVFCDEAVR